MKKWKAHFHDEERWFPKESVKGQSCFAGYHSNFILLGFQYKNFANILQLIWLKNVQIFCIEWQTLYSKIMYIAYKSVILQILWIPFFFETKRFISIHGIDK